MHDTNDKVKSKEDALKCIEVFVRQKGWLPDGWRFDTSDPQWFYFWSIGGAKARVQRSTGAVDIQQIWPR